jgi:hypothetical protein
MLGAIAAIFPPDSATSAEAFNDCDASMTRPPLRSNSNFFAGACAPTPGHAPAMKGSDPAPITRKRSRLVIVMASGFFECQLTANRPLLAMIETTRDN